MTDSNLTIERRRKAKKIIRRFSFLTLGSGYILYLCLRFLFSEMAKKYLLVAFRTEGEIKPVMYGEACVGCIARIDNHRIDPEGSDTFKGSFESYAAHLVKARKRKLAEDPGFIDKKLKAGSNGNPLFIGENGGEIPTNKDGDPIDGDGKVIEGARGHYELTDELKEAIEEANSNTLFEELFGVVWVGFPPYLIFGYVFRWIKYGQQKAEDGKPSDKVEMHPRDEKVRSLFHRYTQYGIILDDLEVCAGDRLTKILNGDEKTTPEGMSAAGKKTTEVKIVKVQARLDLVFETETKNYKKTLFRTAGLSSAGDWQQALNKEIYDRARPQFGNMDWDSIVSDKDKVEKMLAEIAEEINGVDEDDLPKPKTAISAVRDYGQKIIKISLVQNNLKGDLQQVYENVFRAQKKRDEDIAKAEGQRALEAAPFLGKADGLRAISEVPGGVKMTVAEHLGKIRVYAPSGDRGNNLLLNVSDELTKGDTEERRPKSPAPSGDKEKKP